MDISFFIAVSFLMFFIGVIGLLWKRNTLVLFLCVELMLNAANLLFVSFAYLHKNSIGLVWVFFVLVVAAAEAAAGLAIIINLFRERQVVDVDKFNLLKG